MKQDEVVIFDVTGNWKSDLEYKEESAKMVARALSGLEGKKQSVKSARELELEKKLEITESKLRDFKWALLVCSLLALIFWYL